MKPEEQFYEDQAIRMAEAFTSLRAAVAILNECQEAEHRAPCPSDTYDELLEKVEDAAKMADELFGALDAMAPNGEPALKMKDVANTPEIGEMLAATPFGDLFSLSLDFSGDMPFAVALGLTKDMGIFVRLAEQSNESQNGSPVFEFVGTRAQLTELAKVCFGETLNQDTGN